MYYKQKYIKYKLKYLNLVGGEPNVIDLKKCNPIIISKKNMVDLLSNEYTIENYNLIIAKFQEITNQSVDTKLNENNNSKKCVNKEKENQKEELKKKYLLLEELGTVLINLHEYINVFSLPPFNLSEQVESIRTLIDPNSLEYTEDNIQIFLDRLLGIIPSLCKALEELCKILFSEKFDDINMVNLKDSIFLSLRLQSAPNEKGIFADFDNILANVLVQPLTKLDILINKEFPKAFSVKKDTTIEKTNFIINELKREKDVRIKIKPLLNKIQQLIKRCGFNNKTDFEKKFKIFLLKFKMLDESESTKIAIKNAFIDLLGTIKDKLPTNKCVNFYGMDDVSKYDFYDLLKKIAKVLVELDISSKEDIERKINEIKPFLSTSDRALSFIRKLKPTEESTESVEKPEVKIKRLIDELYDLIYNCIPLQSDFYSKFNKFKDNLNISNIRQVDIADFDEVWLTVDKLKDNYKCAKSFSKKEFSKKELETKLKEIGKLLLSNISELEKEEKQQTEYNITQQNQQEIAAAVVAV
jgi:hypothetical protein